MKKALVAILVLLLIAAAGVYFFLTNLDVLVKAAIEKYGSEVTQTAVRVDRVKIDLRQGAAGVHGLTIANPKGFAGRQAFSLGETSVRINLNSIGKDVIIIDAIKVSAPRVMYEMNAAREGSLNKLYDNIKKSLPASGKASKGKSDDADTGPKLIVRKLVFERGSIDARLVPLDNKTYSIILPELNMANLGAPGGATGSELAKEILGRITRSAQDEVKRQVIDQRFKTAIDAERKKFESAAQKRIDEEKKKLEQQLLNLQKR